LVPPIIQARPLLQVPLFLILMTRQYHDFLWNFDRYFSGARNHFPRELMEAAPGERFRVPRQTKKVDSQNAISYNVWNFHKGR
jgi:hypothetical protein